MKGIETGAIGRPAAWPVPAAPAGRGGHDGSQPRLGRTLAVSIAVHLAVAAAWVGLGVPAAPPASVEVALVSPDSPSGPTGGAGRSAPRFGSGVALRPAPLTERPAAELAGPRSDSPPAAARPLSAPPAIAVPPAAPAPSPAAASDSPVPASAPPAAVAPSAVATVPPGGGSGSATGASPGRESGGSDGRGPAPGAGSRPGPPGGTGSGGIGAGRAAGAAPPGLGPAQPGDGTGGVPAAPRALRDRIQSRVSYPPESILREEEGEVLLRVLVGEGGVPRAIRLARSSGIFRLDEAARRGVSGAAPLPSAPGWYEEPDRFTLR